MRKVLAVVLALLGVAPASAQIIGTLPFTLQNGSIADANQVMSDLNAIVSAVNANAASAGANSNITALNGLSTPLVYTSGGTSSYIGGTSGGSANAQTVASPIPSGFTLIAGKSVTFIAGFTNTGPTQLNVAGTGLTNVFRPGTSGPVALSGAEITAGNVVTAIFDGTQYQITGVSPQSLMPACTVIDWAGATNGGPPGYLLMDGRTVPRSAYATLFNCIAVQGVAATTTASSASVVVPNSSLFQLGWSVGGNNVTCNATITGIPDSTHITISANAGASGATTLTIGPYAQGDCATTFAVGNFVGRAVIMRDLTQAVVTGATCNNAGSIGSFCGTQTKTILQANLPNVSFPVTDPGHSHTGTIPFSQSGTASAQAGSGGTVVNSSQALTINSATTGITVSSGGSGNPLSSLPPVALVDKYIKF